MRILITGTAGFIGFHTARTLLAAGHDIVGVDVVNDYYDTTLKEARLAILNTQDGFTEARLDLADAQALAKVFKDFAPQRVIHLAAQAGVRYSLENPQAYLNSNLQGFLNVLEGCRHAQVEHLVYASSSSVYGANPVMPFLESDGVAHPVSFYAATKQANEAMAHAYAHTYGLPCTGLRFFTVYGPWGRPDMAYFKFTRAILAGQAIDVYNQGQMRRDFTYIGDVVEGICRVLKTVPKPQEKSEPSRHMDPGHSAVAPIALYNIGGGNQEELMTLIHTLEDNLGVQARLNMMPMQTGDVVATLSDSTALWKAIGYKPQTGLAAGTAKFVDWYRGYYA
ncbi:MAG: capsular biosynthesis protein CpsI [Robiginitomaculum sp.]|nr:MAG: capsular biosynthesis protein CpsI [Robiginitomaculum sp.]